MNSRTFYLTAKEDASFRRQQLVEAHSQMRLAMFAGAAIAAAWVGYAIYCLTTASRWPGDIGAGIGIIICSSVYAQARARLGALEALFDGTERAAKANASARPS